MTNRLEKIIRFIKEIEKFKLVERIPYLSDKKRREDDAQHSWHLAMMLLALEKEIESKFDLLHTLKLILVHDLPEIYTGDDWVYTKEDKERKSREEKAAAKKIFSSLPADLAEEFYLFWSEYDEGKTIEAKVAKALDKICYPLQYSLSQKIEWEKPHDGQSAKDYAFPYLEFEPKLKEIFIELQNQVEFYQKN